MAEVDPADVVALTAEGTDAAAVAALAVPLVTEMAKGYTRGQGFTADVPNDDIAAVITTASARFVGNTKQTSMVKTTGPFTADLRSYFSGWTLAELFVLNRYRKRAM